MVALQRFSSGGSERVAALSEDLHEVAGEISAGQLPVRLRRRMVIIDVLFTTLSSC